MRSAWIRKHRPGTPYPVDDEVIAESDRPTLLFETGLPTRYYLPQSDIHMEMLTPTDSRTGCPYKGFARYWNVTTATATHDDDRRCSARAAPRPCRS